MSLLPFWNFSPLTTFWYFWPLRVFWASRYFLLWIEIIKELVKIVFESGTIWDGCFDKQTIFFCKFWVCKPHLLKILNFFLFFWLFWIQRGRKPNCKTFLRFWGLFGLKKAKRKNIIREKISGPGRDFRPGPGKNLARPGIRARAGFRAPKTRAENRRARAGLRKPGLQNRRAGRPGPVPIPGSDWLKKTFFTLISNTSTFSTETRSWCKTSAWT